jgi:hypothetical protein
LLGSSAGLSSATIAAPLAGIRYCNNAVSPAADKLNRAIKGYESRNSRQREIYSVVQVALSLTLSGGFTSPEPDAPVLQL